jgi:hypothetical protein
VLVGEFSHHFDEVEGGGGVEAIGRVVETEDAVDNQQEITLLDVGLITKYEDLLWTCCHGFGEGNTPSFSAADAPDRCVAYLCP